MLALAVILKFSRSFPNLKIVRVQGMFIRYSLFIAFRKLHLLHNESLHSHLDVGRTPAGVCLMVYTLLQAST